MPRSTLAFAFLAAFAGVACARASDNPPVVTAPVTSAAPAATAGAAALASTADASPAGDSGPVSAAATAPDDGGVAAFQACQADSDCVAVPRVGCCHNGYNEAVNVTQKDAYEASFTCPRRQPCPMFIIRDRGIPRCDPATHLCKLVQPTP